MTPTDGDPGDEDHRQIVTSELDMVAIVVDLQRTGRRGPALTRLLAMIAREARSYDYHPEV